MKLIIHDHSKRNNSNIIIDIHPYQSFHSILNSLDFINDDNIHQYYFTLNQKIIYNQFSPDYYELKENSIIELNYRLEGGGFSSFMKLFKKYWYWVLIIFAIALAPLAYLPLGLIPITASLLKIVFDQSFEKIGVYLATELGKYSLYNRLKLFTTIIKYVIFILIVYVSFTFPLMLLCFMLKGNLLGDSPKSLCSPYNAATITGLVLTVLYLLIYNSYRSTGQNLDWLKNIFKKNQYTHSTLAPATEALKKGYNQFKYFTMMKNPITGLYFNFLDKTADTATALINTLIEFGCNVPSEEKFKKKFTEQINNFKSFENKNEIKIEIPTTKDNQCCDPKNYFAIGKLIYEYVNQKEDTLKTNDMYSSAIMIAITFIERSLCVESTDIQKAGELLKYLESRLETFAKEQNNTYVPTSHGMYNAFIKTFFFYSICNVFTLAKNTSSTIQEMGSMYEVIDMLKSGTATGNWAAFFYTICFIALLICGLFDIY
jgi:hypothetical protein